MDSETKEQAAPASQALATIPSVNYGSGLALYLDVERMNQLYKVADMFAQSDIIPAQFKGKKGNCFIALEMAGDMNVKPLFLMQNLVVVSGKPTLEAKLVTAMVNTSGRFTNGIEYEITGAKGIDSDPDWNKEAGKPKDPTYKVRAFATTKNGGKMLRGPWISWDMALGEGWVQKDKSKWKTMPEMMFMYRAASYFAKQHCTDITFGMQTTEEMNDVIDITPAASPVAGGRARAKASKILSGFEAEPATGEQVVEGELEPDYEMTYSHDPETCEHSLDTMEDHEGGAICNLCGSTFELEEGAPTIAEQKAIRAQELKDAETEQAKLFT